jgi:hypothetical protein
LPDQLVALRCKYCGAPFDEEQVKSDSPYIKCNSCGTTQQRMDAKAYLDQLTAEVKSWLSTAMPLGLPTGGMETVDPVARHSIFVKDVQPKIQMELTEYKFSNMSLLGNCLLVMPFTTTSVFHPVHTSNKAFEFNAKVKSVAPLAVDDASQAVITEAASLSQSYAMMINNISLLAEDKDGRYILMANNFTASADAIRKDKEKELLVTRFDALSGICNGIDRLLAGDLATAEPMIRKGRDSLVSIKDKVFTNPQMGIMSQGINQEIAICDVVLNIMDIVKTSGNSDPLAMLNIIRQVMNQSLPSNQAWGYLLGRKERYNEVFTGLIPAIAAKTSGTVPIAAGDGDILIPFWEVDLRYSFETGALWKKKSVEVKEDLLICADFVTDADCLNDPSVAITDIFSVRPPKSILAGISGSETSISGGAGIGKIQDSVADGSANGRSIVAPLSTKREAEKLCSEYLARKVAADSKLKLSKPDVKRIIYVPCKREGNTVTAPADFGNLVPGRLRKMDLGKSIVI